MNIRILLFPALLALALLAACGGGSDSPSPTPSAGAPTATPSPTPEPTACTASNLYGALVSAEGAAGTQFLTIGFSNIANACQLEGAPTINWYDTAGTKLDVPAATGVQCQPQAGDFTTCAYGGRFVLPAGAATPAANVNGQAIAIVGVNNVDAGQACPSAAAHFLGLQLPSVSIEIQVELAEDVSVSCTSQITLQGYGPLPTREE